MLNTGSIQVLPAVTDNANLYVALNTIAAGQLTKTYSAQALQLNPSSNVLTVGTNTLIVNSTANTVNTQA